MTYEPLPQEDQWVDIGHGHAYQFVLVDDGMTPIAVWVSHTCEKHPDIKMQSARIPFIGENAWKLENVNPLTISPSILRTDCGDHGFIREGKWILA